MTMQARGTFVVKLTSQDLGSMDAAYLGARSIDKRFSGDLEGTSRGLMLAAGTPVKGSAGYVAIERVTGTLEGRQGEFTLQHHGIMNRGEGTLHLVVIPDSATDALEGLSGSMRIIIADGTHSYEFDYILPPR